MVPLKNKKHIFFDFDDTLWDFEKNSSTAIEQVFDAFNLAEKTNTNFEKFYITYKRILQSLWADFQKNKIDKTYLRNNRFYLSLLAFGYNNFEESLEINEQYKFFAPRGTILKEGCKQILNYLSCNYDLHIVTNGFKQAQLQKIEGCGLKHYFKSIVISEEYQLKKPDSQIFRLAESISGAVKNDCVMIGDDFEADIQGAFSAGWEAVYFSEQNKDFNGYRIKSLIELEKLF